MNSKNLESFLNFLRESQEKYKICNQIEDDTNGEILDLEHVLELGEISYHEYAKIAKAIREVKQKRRVAKETKVQLQPLIIWANKNDKTIHELEQVLGNMRKEEKNSSNRYYHPRTDIIQKTLNKDYDEYTFLKNNSKGE